MPPKILQMAQTPEWGQVHVVRTSLVVALLPLLRRGHDFESLLIYGLANFEKVQARLDTAVMVNTPWSSLVEGEAGCDEAAGRQRRPGPERSQLAAIAAANADRAARANAEIALAESDSDDEMPAFLKKPAAKPATAHAAKPATAPAAKPAVAKTAPASGRPSRPASTKSKMVAEADAPPAKAQKADPKEPRMTGSAAVKLHAELAQLRAGACLPSLPTSLPPSIPHACARDRLAPM